MLDGTEYFECQCGSPEHTLRFTLDREENEIYTEVFLNQWHPFWKRIWIAIKYVFGYKCIYGHFDCFSMQREDAERLMSMASQIVPINLGEYLNENPGFYGPEESPPSEDS